MRGYLVGLLLIGACYSPTVPEEVPCSADGECPSGQMCIAAKCTFQLGSDGSNGSGSDAGTPAPGDRDADGVPDATDNCPDIQNADQADEDGDKIGDACDLCPQISDTGTDTDGDQVGDACDPNPALKDRVWLYSGFHGGQLPTWTRSTNWTATGDLIQTVSAGNTNSDGEYMITPFTPAPAPATAIDNFSITASLKVPAEAGAKNDHSTGLEVYDATSKKWVDCGLDHSPGAGANAIMFLEEDNTNGTTGNLTKSIAFGWAINLTYRLTETRHGTTYTCTVVGPDGTMATLTGTSQVVPRDGTALEIWAYGATVQFNSLQITGAP